MKIKVLLDLVADSAELDMVTHMQFHPEPFLGVGHRHLQLYQICYMVKGASRLEVDGEALTMNSGDAIFVFPGQWHGPAQGVQGEVAEVMQIKFALKRILRWRRPGLIHVDARLEYEAAFRGLFGEYYMRRPLREPVMRNHLVQLILILARSRDAERPGGRSRPRERLLARDERKVRLAMEWMSRHYREHVALKDVAAAAGMSVSALSHAFRAMTGISPIRYLVDFRLAQAVTIMQRTDDKLDDVAEAAGFSSASYLCRMFKKHFKQAPRRYADR